MTSPSAFDSGNRHVGSALSPGAFFPAAAEADRRSEKHTASATKIFVAARN
jgi:hypothetical protein